MLDLPSHITLRFASRALDDEYPLAPLSAEERARLATFKSDGRRRAFALGRATLRELLADRLALAGAEAPLVVAADGALELPAGALHVSLSHTTTEGATIALAAVASGAIGVDVEVLRPRHPELYRRILHPDEYPLLDSVSEGWSEGQVMLWAMKEAVLKACRTGFRVAARDVRLSLEEGRQRGTAVVAGAQVWEVRYAERDGCAVAVAFLQ